MNLLTLAAKQFDVFITVDRNLWFQQNVPSFDIAVLILRAPSNRLSDMRPLAPKVLDALPKARRGKVTWVGP